MADVLQTADIS